MLRGIKNIAKRIVSVDIVRVFSLTAMSTLVKMLAGFVSIKVVAIILGPSGLALMGQLSNFATIAMAVASVGINNGVTKYVAEYKDDKPCFRELLSTAWRITLIGSIAVGIFMIATCYWLGPMLLKSSEYDYIFVVFGLTILLYAANNLLLSIVNGLKQFALYVKISIANTILGLAYTVALVLAMGLHGAMISFVTYQSISLVITIFMLRHTRWFSFDDFKNKISKPVASKYFHYTLMTSATIALVPMSQLLLRDYVISILSMTEAGWWEAMNRISAMYLMVVTSSFGIYYLPRLSELNSREELKTEIIKAYKVIIPILVVGFTLIYVLRFFVIRLLFTPAFAPMENLFLWQLLGDLFKISSWLLAFLMVAKAKTVMYISTEIVFALLYVGLAFWFVGIHGINGLVQAYFVNYVLYALMMLFLFRKMIWCR